MPARDRRFHRHLLLLAIAMIAGVGAEEPAPAGSAEALTLTSGGAKRTCLLYVPPHPAQAPGLVIVLHGGGSDGAGMRRMTHSAFDRLADRDGALVAYPDGIDHSWNDGRPNRLQAQRAGVDDIGFLRDLIAEVKARHALDGRRVFVTGMSNGAVMCYRVARELPDQVAAIAPVAGLIPRADAGKPWAKPVPTLLIEGDADPLMPFAGGPVHLGRKEADEILSAADTVARLVAWNAAEEKGDASDLPDVDPADGTRVRREHHAGGDAGAEVDYYRVLDGGHAWPGGNQYLPERLIGKTSRDIEACAVIWEFFARHGKAER